MLNRLMSQNIQVWQGYSSWTRATSPSEFSSQQQATWTARISKKVVQKAATGLLIAQGIHITTVAAVWSSARRFSLWNIITTLVAADAQSALFQTNPV